MSSPRNELFRGVGVQGSASLLGAAIAWGDLVKRFFDITFAGLALVLVSPLLLAIAVAILLDSPGPVFFSHRRVGWNRRRSSRRPSPAGERRSRLGYGQEFEILKFRTMRFDADPYATCPAASSDPRITRIGRILRKTCFDELPQLVNVLRGEMSLVGPRPEMPFLVCQYDLVQRRRLEVLPGLTGLWQVRGPRDRAIHEAIEWDLEYLERRSLRSDIAILAETLSFMFRLKNR